MMDEYYSKVQMMLTSEDNKHKLRLLSSRITKEDSDRITEICNRMKDIFQHFDIPIDDNVSKSNVKCIEAFKFLVLNTNFKIQEQLLEDVSLGHLVSMCPPMSSYLLIEILFYLHYEDLLAESILYFPLELVIEILEIINRCISMLQYKRAFSFIINCISNSYKLFIIAHRTGVQSLYILPSLDSLGIHVEELIDVLITKKLLRANNPTEMSKSERLGFALRSIMKMIKNSFQSEQDGVDIDPEREKLYKITFGEQDTMNCDSKILKSHLDLVNLALLNLLMTNLKEIDVNVYLAWADVEDNNSPSTSLQQAVGFDCYHMLKYLQEYQAVEVQNDLVDCLQQLSSKPKDLSTANISELCKDLEEGKRESLKELMSRYESWDSSTFEYVRKNYSMLDRDDYSILLDYLTLLMEKSSEEEHIQNVHITLTKVLTNLSILDVYKVVIDYILKYDCSDRLESIHTEEMFNSFIHRNINLKLSTNLRIVLFFMQKNPKKILTLLIQVSIGCSEWKNTMIPPKDMLLLEPIMIIRDKNNDKLILNVLRAIAMGTYDWESKKFINFIQTMIENDIFTADESMNSILIPMIGENDNSDLKIKFSLNAIRQIMVKCTEKMNLGDLLINLARTMSLLRRSTKIPKHMSNKLLMMVVRIIKSLLHYNEDWLRKDESRKTIDKVVRILHPIDQIHFYRLWYLTTSPDITDIINDYRRRIECTIRRVSDDINPTPIEFKNLLQDVQRHLILNTTMEEFFRIASEMTVIHWRYFQENPAETDENDAVHQFIKMSIEMSCYCLELPDRVAPDMFGFLLKSIVKFIREIILLKNKWNYSELIKCLRDNMKSISTNVSRTEYKDFYIEALTLIDNCPSDKPAYELLIKILEYLDDLSGKCVEVTQPTSLDKNNLNIIKLAIPQDFINDCLQFEYENESSIMRRVNELLFNMNNVGGDDDDEK